MDHGDALFAHAAGRRLQVQLRRHRDDKDEIIPAGPLRHQCLVHAGRVLAHALGHMDAVHGHALLVGILMRRIGHLGPFQNPHRVGFCFFSHNHVLPITSLPSQSPTATAPPTGELFSRSGKNPLIAYHLWLPCSRALSKSAAAACLCRKARHVLRSKALFTPLKPARPAKGSPFGGAGAQRLRGFCPILPLFPKNIKKPLDFRKLK